MRANLTKRKKPKALSDQERAERQRKRAKEKEARKPSQYNAECPTIHPNYNKPAEDS